MKRKSVLDNLLRVDIRYKTKSEWYLHGTYRNCDDYYLRLLVCYYHLSL